MYQTLDLTLCAATDERAVGVHWLLQAKRELERLKMRNTALHMKTSEHMTNVAVAKTKAAEATQAAVKRNS